MTGVALAVGAVAVAGGPVGAASTVSFNGRDLVVWGGPYKNFAVTCSPAGRVLVNGVGVPGDGRCADVTWIEVTIDDEDAITASNTIDLRGVTKALFPKLRATSLYAFNGDDRVYGSEADDRITGGGKLTGDRGNDHITAWPDTSPKEVRGGDGDDMLEGGSGDDVIDGGNGNDQLSSGLTPGGVDIYQGRGGNDRIFPHVIPGVQIYAGAGDDLVAAASDRRGPGTFSVDLGEGTSDIIRLDAPSGTRLDNGSVSDPTVIRTRWNQTTFLVRRAERVVLLAQDRGAYDVLMQPTAAIVVGAFLTNTTIRVPGGIWTRNQDNVTAPDLQPVSWLNPSTVTIGTA